jgi:cold shock CspA family protein
MGRSQETFSKKEREKQKIRKRQDKEAKREERKANSDKGKDLEDMMAYVDENGNITTVPPDPKKKKEIKAEDISLSATRQPDEAVDIERTGCVTMFNQSKGYGFIKDDVSKEGIFVHINQCSELIGENDKVSFKIENSPKGMAAIDVKKIS